MRLLLRLRQSLSKADKFAPGRVGGDACDGAKVFLGAVLFLFLNALLF